MYMEVVMLTKHVPYSMNLSDIEPSAGHRMCIRDVLGARIVFGQRLTISKHI